MVKKTLSLTIKLVVKKITIHSQTFLETKRELRKKIFLKGKEKTRRQNFFQYGLAINKYSFNDFLVGNNLMLIQLKRATLTE